MYNCEKNKIPLTKIHLVDKTIYIKFNMSLGLGLTENHGVEIHFWAQIDKVSPTKPKSSWARVRLP